MEKNINIFEEHKTFLKVFPERIKIALRMRNMTQRDLAEAIGTTEVTISRYVNGERVPKGPVIVAMAKAIDCPVSWLICKNVSDEDLKK